MTSEETEDAGAWLKPGRRANWLALRRRGRRPYLEQRGEDVEGVDGAGAVRVAHELVDVAAPGLLGVVAGRGLKGGQDGREKGRGRGRDAPLAFSKAAKKGHDHVRRRRPSPRGEAARPAQCPPLRWLWGPSFRSESRGFLSDSRKAKSPGRMSGVPPRLLPSHRRPRHPRPRGSLSAAGNAAPVLGPFQSFSFFGTKKG